MSNITLFNTYTLNYQRGFGYFLASSLFLYDYCNSNGYCFDVYYEHPNMQFIMNDNYHTEKTKKLVSTTIKKIVNIDDLSTILAQSSDEYYFVNIQLSVFPEKIYNLLITNEIKNIFIEKCFNFKNDFINLFHRFLDKYQLIEKKYTVIHCHISDIPGSDLNPLLMNHFIRTIKYILNLQLNKNTVLLSNRYDFKESIKNIIPSIIISESIPGHSTHIHDNIQTIMQDLILDIMCLIHSNQTFILSSKMHTQQFIGSSLSKMVSLLMNIHHETKTFVLMYKE